MHSSAVAIAFLCVTFSVTPSFAEDASAAEAAVPEAPVSTLQSGAEDTRELAGGYHLGDQVVALVDFESTSGRVSKGDLGTAVAKGSAPNSITCNFENYQGFEASFAQIGATSTVLNGGFHIGDKVVALIDWEGAAGGITRGDVGMVLDQGRGTEGLVVDFPRLKRLSVLLAQIGKVGASLNGGYGVGDKVVSLIDWAGSAGKISAGDVGIALGRGNGEKGLIVDFPGIKNLNIMLHQIERAGAPSTATQPVAKEEAAATVQTAPEKTASQLAALQSGDAAPASDAKASEAATPPAQPAQPAQEQLAALQDGDAAAQTQARAEAEAEAGSAAAPASEAKASEGSAPSAQPAQEQLAALQGGEAASKTQAGTEAEAGSAAASTTDGKASDDAAPAVQAAQEQLAAVQGGEAAPQTQAGSETEAGSAAPPASEAKNSDSAVSPAQPMQPAQEDMENMEALQGLASSLSQKLAKKKEAAAAAEASQLDSIQGLATSLAKKLEQAKENRVVSEKEAMPARRSVLKADEWPMDGATGDGAKPSMFQRLVGPLLGKTRNSDAEVEALSLMQEGAKVAKRPLLSGKKKHDEL